MDYEAIKKATIELLKEALRWAIITAASAFITYVADNLTTIPMSPEYIVYMAGFLRGVDKFIHTYGKVSGNDSATKGITRF